MLVPGALVQERQCQVVKCLTCAAQRDVRRHASLLQQQEGAVRVEGTRGEVLGHGPLTRGVPDIDNCAAVCSCHSMVHGWFGLSNCWRGNPERCSLSVRARTVARCVRAVTSALRSNSRGHQTSSG